jgi:hypothetical protein
MQEARPAAGYLVGRGRDQGGVVGGGRWGDGVVGDAQGDLAGNALNWTYTLALPVDGTIYHVQFNDWMYLVSPKVMLNKAKMSKFGIELGEVTLSFYKR